MRPLLFLAALLALAGSLFADVKNGDTYTHGGVSVTVTITARPSFNDVQVTYKSAGTNSGPHTGTPGSNSSSANPTAEAAGQSTPLGGNRFRVHGGKMQRKNGSGEWVDMGRPRKGARGGIQWVRAGDYVPRDGVLRPDEAPLDGREQGADPNASPIPVKAHDTFPFDGWFGDDVTTLPDDPDRTVDL